MTTIKDWSNTQKKQVFPSYSSRHFAVIYKLKTELKRHEKSELPPNSLTLYNQQETLMRISFTNVTPTNTNLCAGEHYHHHRHHQYYHIRLFQKPSHHLFTLISFQKYTKSAPFFPLRCDSPSSIQAMYG